MGGGQGKKTCEEQRKSRTDPSRGKAWPSVEPRRLLGEGRKGTSGAGAL